MLSDLLEFVKQLQQAFDEADFIKLRHIGKKAIEKAALSNDKTYSKISVLSYSLGKISGKEHIAANPDWRIARKQISRLLDDAVQKLKGKDVGAFEKDLEELIHKVSIVDENLGNYFVNIYDKAKIKMASSAYALGLSLSKAAELTDADKKQVLEYIGRTKMHDEEGITHGIADRLKNLRRALR